MTPSDAHDMGRERDAGHDAIQLAVAQYINAKWPKETEWTAGYSWDQSCVMTRRGPFVEYPLSSKSGVQGFVDIAINWEVKINERWYQRWQFFEVKPKIYSCGALLRQITKFSNDVAPLIVPAYGSAVSARFEVLPVVLSDDPKLKEFLTFYEMRAAGDSLRVFDGKRFIA